MKIRLNGEHREIDAELTVEDLLTKLDYDAEQVAVAINEQFVPRPLHFQTTVKEGDRVEIVGPVQGG